MLGGHDFFSFLFFFSFFTNIDDVLPLKYETNETVNCTTCLFLFFSFSTAIFVSNTLYFLNAQWFSFLDLPGGFIYK